MNIGGNANVECIQTASLEQVQNCKQLSSAIAKTTNNTFQELGLKTSTTNKTSDSTISSNTAKSENISTGVLQDLGSALSNIIDSIGFAFLTPYLMSSCSIFCCIIIMLCLGVVAKLIASNNSASSNNLSQSLSTTNLPTTNLSATNLSKSYLSK
jgi:hypothetical protein